LATPDHRTNGQPESIATAITEISDKLTQLVHDEIELAKTEVEIKAKSLAIGSAAVGAGAAFGVFAILFLLLTLAWVIDAIFFSETGSIWVGFFVVFILLVLLVAATGFFAWRKLRVGPPTPQMAIDEARKIRDTVSAQSGLPD
jgi:hypothetical protein